MNKHMKKWFTPLFLLVWAFSCSPDKESATSSALPESWEALEAQARGTRLTLMMWQGDPMINRYMSDFVVPAMKDSFGIELDILSGQGNIIVSTLMTEMEAGRKESQIDAIWINGETFYQLRQIKGLFGPFVDRLPNSRLIDWDNPFIHTDFQQPIEGYECPWGNVQMAWIYDSSRISTPPADLEALELWLRANPGKFTLSNDFTGMTLLKSWLIHFAGGRDALQGPFDESKYLQSSQKLWEFVNRNKPYFWNRGESFPASLSQMHQLFASGELWFTFSNNDAEVDNKVREGLFPESSRAFVPDYGSIQNSHYLGIVAQAPNKAAAMVLCNFLISPEAQIAKLDPLNWGDGTVLSPDRLDAPWREKMSEVGERQYVPPRSALAPKALMEPDPVYMIRLFEDFRKKVLSEQ